MGTKCAAQTFVVQSEVHKLFNTLFGALIVPFDPVVNRDQWRACEFLDLLWRFSARVKRQGHVDLSFFGKFRICDVAIWFHHVFGLIVFFFLHVQTNTSGFDNFSFSEQVRGRIRVYIEYTTTKGSFLIKNFQYSQVLN